MMAYVGGRLEPLFDPTPVRRALSRMANTGGKHLHEYVVRNTPIESGNLRSSWYQVPVKLEFRDVYAGPDSAYKSTVATDVHYAPYVEHGTGLYGPEHRKYLIQPKAPSGWLSWIDKATGRRIFAKRVWHPGSPGAHMMLNALAKVEALYSSILDADLRLWQKEQEAQAIQANEPR